MNYARTFCALPGGNSPALGKCQFTAAAVLRVALKKRLWPQVWAGPARSWHGLEPEVHLREAQGAGQPAGTAAACGEGALWA